MDDPKRVILKAISRKQPLAISHDDNRLPDLSFTARSMHDLSELEWLLKKKLKIEPNPATNECSPERDVAQTRSRCNFAQLSDIRFPTFSDVMAF